MVFDKGRQLQAMYPVLRCSAALCTYYLTYMKARVLNDIPTAGRKSPIWNLDLAVIFVEGGEPLWYEVSVGGSPVLGSPGFSEGYEYAMGILQMSGGETLFRTGYHIYSPLEDDIPVALIGNEHKDIEHQE